MSRDPARPRANPRATTPPLRAASSRANSPRRPAERLGRTVPARGELAGALDQPGVDLGGALLMVERRTGQRGGPRGGTEADRSCRERLTGWSSAFISRARDLVTLRAWKGELLRPDPGRGRGGRRRWSF